MSQPAHFEDKVFTFQWKQWLTHKLAIAFIITLFLVVKMN